MIRFKNILSTTLIGVVLFCSCTPTQRLNRLITKHPYLAQTSIDTMYIPDIRYDTTIVLEKDTAGLSTFLDSLFESIPDTCKPIIKILKEPIIKYVDRMVVLTDTAEYEYMAITDSTSAKLLIKVWQEGKDLRLSVEVLESQILINTQHITVEPPKNKNWIFFIGFGIILFIVLLKMFLK